MSDIWKCVRGLEGQTLHTLHQRHAFTIVDVRAQDLDVVPEEGKKVKRTMIRERIEQVALSDEPRERLVQLARHKYPESRNTSYLAAIAHAAREAMAAQLGRVL